MATTTFDAPRTRRASTARRRRSTAGAAKLPQMSELIQTLGGAIAIALGLSFVFVIAIVAMGTVPAEGRAAVASASFAALGTIVGAYAGVRLGSAGREHAEAGRAHAEAARDEEAIRVQALAAMLDAGAAAKAFAEADRRAAAHADRRRASAPTA